MPNANTAVQAITAANGRLPSDALGASSTAEFQFSKSSSRYVLTLPGSSKCINRPIRIKAWGRVTGGTTTNFTVKLYSGSSATIGSNTSIATSGAIAVNSVSGNFWLEAEGVWDSTSDKFQGLFRGHINGTAVAAAILSSVTQPGADPSTEGNGLTVTGTFSASNASNAAILDGFEVEVL
jgi:hypothetical protein